ncbi:MAG: response regulator [Candidatus Zixiibacteriota bacterium]
MIPVIMLVEDNDDHAELITEALKNTVIAIRVVRFADAESALEYFEATGGSTDDVDNPLPEVVLLDLKLPGMNGLDMLKRLRTNPKTKKIPVVILTTSKRDEEIARGYEYGANSYIVKPVKYEEFRAKIIDLKMYWILTSELPRNNRETARN